MRVLVVDDDPALQRSLVRMLAGHDVVAVGNANHARVYMRTSVFGAIISDYDLGPDCADEDGLAVLRAARDLQPHARRILMSGAMPATALAARDEGLAHALLDKPFSTSALVEALGVG